MNQWTCKSSNSLAERGILFHSSSKGVSVILTRHIAKMPGRDGPLHMSCMPVYKVSLEKSGESPFKKVLSKIS